MFNNLSIRSRLLLILCAMSFLAISLSVIGLIGIKFSNSSLQTVYIDRLVPTTQLTNIKFLQIDSRLRVANSVIFPQEAEKNIAKINENVAEINKLWDSYMATYLTPDEKILADKFVANRKIYRDEALFPTLALAKSGDSEGLKKLIVEKIRPLFEPVSKGIDDLVQLQVDVSQQEYEDAQKSYNAILIGSIVTLILGLGSCLFVDLALIRRFTSSIANAKSVATAIAHGNFNSQIVVDANDEVSSLLHSMQTMQNTLVSFVNAQGLMAKKHSEGWIAEKIDAAKFEGNYGSMAKSINELVQAHIDVNMHVVDIVSGYAKGDFKRDIDNLPGDKAKITKAITGVKTALLSINNEIEMLASTASQGDFSKRANAGNFDFMFKSMLTHLNTLVGTCDGAFNDVLRVSNALAEGDLTQSITKDYPGVFGQVKSGMNNTVEGLTALIAEIKETTSTISAVSTEIASGNNDLAHRTEQQAAALEETAASMHELTSTVTHNSDNAKQANMLAVGATETASRGVSVVKEVVSTMDNINESSLRIVDINFSH